MPALVPSGNIDLERFEHAGKELANIGYATRWVRVWLSIDLYVNLVPPGFTMNGVTSTSCNPDPASVSLSPAPGLRAILRPLFPACPRLSTPAHPNHHLTLPPPSPRTSPVSSPPRAASPRASTLATSFAPAPAQHPPFSPRLAGGHSGLPSLAAERATSSVAAPS